MLWLRPLANSARNTPVSRLTVPATTSTHAAISRVPVIAFCRPPVRPVVVVVSTLHCQCGTARATTPTASQRVGPITTTRARKHRPQKTLFATLRRAEIAGYANSSAWEVPRFDAAGLDDRPSSAIELTSDSPADGQCGA